MDWNADNVRREIDALMIQRLEKTAITLQNRVRETLSEPPKGGRRKVIGRSGVPFYVARNPATPGAPPRKITGRFRSTMAYMRLADNGGFRVGTNDIRGRPFETWMNHPFLMPTLDRCRGELEGIAGQPI